MSCAQSQQLPSFNFQNNSIRVTGTPEAPLFVLSDVCRVLVLQNINHTVKQIQEEFAGVTLNVTPLQTAGGIQNVLVITEPQLYFVMMRSRAKLAKAFRQWIVNEVIPAIRKTGGYVAKHQEHPQAHWYVPHILDIVEHTNLTDEEKNQILKITDRAKKQGVAIGLNLAKAHAIQAQTSESQKQAQSLTKTADIVKLTLTCSQQEKALAKANKTIDKLKLELKNSRKALLDANKASAPTDVVCLSRTQAKALLSDVEEVGSYCRVLASTLTLVQDRVASRVSVEKVFEPALDKLKKFLKR